MAAMTAPKVADCAAKIAGHLFQGQAPAIGGATEATANIHLDDLKAAVVAVDAAADTTLATAAAGSGGMTVAQYLASAIPPPTSGGTAQQKSVLVACVVLERVNLL